MLPGYVRKQGFTLVELLVVIALFGAFAAAVYSLYLTHMKTAFTQEDVIDVQQNVRIAMESLTRDIMMAGFLVPPESSGKTLYLDRALTNYSSMICLRTASADATFGRLNSTAVTMAGPLTVAPAAVLDRFRGGDAVRIVRPLNITQPSNNVFNVISSNRNSATMTLANTTSGIEYRAGDVICKVNSSGAPYPETVTYTIVPCNDNTTTCLARSVNVGTASVDVALVAQGIRGVKFSYLLDDGTETHATSDMNSEDKLSTLRAVRVTITGQTSRPASPGDAPKTRQLASIVKLRNRR